MSLASSSARLPDSSIFCEDVADFGRGDLDRAFDIALSALELRRYRRNAGFYAVLQLRYEVSKERRHLN